MWRNIPTGTMTIMCRSYYSNIIIIRTGLNRGDESSRKFMMNVTSHMSISTNLLTRAREDGHKILIYQQ